MNLTRDEAARRAEILHVESYELAFDLTTGPEQFAVTATIRFTCSTPGESTFLDFVAPSVSEVVLNGRALDVATVFDGARIALDDLAGTNELRVVGDGAYSRTGEGLHRFVDPVDDEVYLYTQFESTDARRAYPCFDQPDLKATFRLDVTAPSHWKVVSNAVTPEPEHVGEGVARWRFDATPRLSTYVTALVAGPYHEVRDSYAGPHGTYELGLFCRESLASALEPDDIFGLTKEGFAFFEDAFATPYPFGKYDQLFVPEFNAGAMENVACVTFHEDLLFRSKVTDAAYEQRSNTILHEMAHMWFGDLVTMRWWDDLWLNESFAEWASHYANANATRYREAWTTFCNLRKAWAYRQDQLPSTHPIASDMVDIETVRVNFDGITYAKGASALRQLVAWVGDQEFLAGLKVYFAKHAWGNTRLDDLLAELSAASGRDLSGWSSQWLETAGVNTLHPEVTLDDAGRYASVAVIQEPPTVPAGIEPVLRSHRIGIGLYERDAHGDLRRTSFLELDVEGARTEVPKLVGVTQPDLLLLNDGDLTFAKVRLDPRSQRTLVESIGSLDDSLARAVCWGAAWDLTRDGEMPTRDYLELVLSGLPTETSITVVQQNLRQLRSALDLYADPAWRDEGVTRLANALEPMMRQAEPGSDRQLAFVRAFAGSARTDAQLDVVRGLLDGSAPLDGLEVDTDLRWALLQRLVSKGKADDDAIDAELARDDTAAGRRQAAVARASEPSTEAKARAWASVVDDDELPNAMQTATISGFQQPEQVDLLRPYVERYFDAAVDAWATRSTEMAQNIAIGLYPALVVEPATVEASDAFLARDDLHPALRRLVAEGRDGVARALRAQECDRAAAGRS
jgi:aminopeptidase N